MRRAVRLLAASCLIAVFAGCTPPTAPPPSPTSTPSPRPEDPLDRQRRLDFAAAEQAYRSYTTGLDRVLIGGGSRKLPADLLRTAGGKILATAEQGVLAYYETDSRQEGHTKLVSFADGGYSPQELLLNVCIDGRSVKTYTKNKLVATDKLKKAEVTVRKDGDVWKAWSEKLLKEGACGV